MTLCIAWRSEGGTIRLASDSRLSFAQHIPAVDVCPKLHSVRVEIHGPVAAGSSLDESVPKTTIGIGLAFAGSTVASLALASTLSQLLARLQYNGNFIVPSIESVCQTILRFYEQANRKFGEALCERGWSSFLLCARCPVRKEQCAFEFSVDSGGKCSFTEILAGERPSAHALGSGAAAARPRLLRGDEPLTVLHDLIDDPKVSGVGGPVQFGELGECFRILAVEDYVIPESSDTEDMSYVLPLEHYFAGFHLPSPQPMFADGGLIVPYRLLAEFRERSIRVSKARRAGSLGVGAR